MLRRFIPLLTVAVLALNVSGSPAAAPATTTAPAKLAMSGPLANLTFCQSYSYTVSVVSRRSYAHAFVGLSSSVASGYVNPRNVHLIAHRPWRGTFTEIFSPVFQGKPATLELGVLVLPPHHGYEPLGSKRFPLTFMPTAPETTPSSCPPPSYFGS